MRSIKLALVALALAACSSRGALVVVHVEAAPPLAGIAAVHATVSALGTMRDFDLSPAPTSTPFLFAVELPPSASGAISVHVTLTSASGAQLGAGDGAGTIKPGDTTDLTITIGAAQLDGGADLGADLAVDMAAVDMAASDMAKAPIDLAGADLTPRVITTLAFAVPKNYIAGNHPEWVAVGDFNGDGWPDLVVVNFYLDAANNNVSVLINKADGTGTFQPAVSYAAGTSTSCVAVGDLNGDSKLDFAVSNRASNSVSLFIGNGAGVFTSGGSLTTGVNPESVALADFNHDGYADVVTANNGTGTASVFLTTGPATYAAAVPYSAATPHAVAIGDFNGDTFADFVVADASGQASIFLNNGAAVFGNANPYTTGANPISIAVADFNGDLAPDLVTANFTGNSLSVLLNTGVGTMNPKTDYPPARTPSVLQAVAVGDFNIDGRPDVIAVDNGYDHASVLMNKGAGLFNTAVPFFSDVATSVAVGDFNRDGLPDFVVTASTGANVVLNTSN